MVNHVGTRIAFQAGFPSPCRLAFAGLGTLPALYDHRQNRGSEGGRDPLGPQHLANNFRNCSLSGCSQCGEDHLSANLAFNTLNILTALRFSVAKLSCLLNL